MTVAAYIALWWSLGVFALGLELFWLGKHPEFDISVKLAPTRFIGSLAAITLAFGPVLLLLVLFEKIRSRIIKRNR